MTTAIYVRISRDATSERAGVQRQLEDCRELCERNGWKVAHVFEDNDVSAADRRMNRPAYARLIELVRAGLIERIATFHMDRLYRQPRELEDLIDLAEQGSLQVETVEGSLYDLNSIEGRKRARDAVATAKYESEKMGWRISRAKEQKARHGQPAGGGLRAFGYERNGIDVNEAEAALIREAAERVIGGDSLGAICRDWAARGVKTTRDNLWRVGSLRLMLCRPRLAGLREYRGEILGDAVWEPVLDRERWEQVRLVLTDPSRKQPGPRRRYLLSGIARCGECGQPLRTQNVAAQGYFTYTCRSEPGRRCGRVRVKGPDLDELISESLLAALDSPTVGEALTRDRPELAPLRERLLLIESRIDELAGDYARGRIARREWLAARDSADAEATALRRRLNGAKAQNRLAAIPAGEAIRDIWDKASVDWRRDLIRAVMSEVIVNRATRGGTFDPDRVDVRWVA